MYCNDCGTDAGSAKYCPNCGRFIQQNTSSNLDPNININKLSEVNNLNKNKKNRGCLTALLVVILITVVIGFNFLFNNSDSSESSKTDLPTISASTIYSDKAVVIKATGMQYNSTWDTYVVKVDIKNNSAKTISFSVSNAVVNGYTILTSCYGEIYSGMNRVAEVGLSSDEISLAGISKICEIKFTIECSYDDTDAEICKAEADLKTSNYGSYTQSYDFNGTEIYNSNGLRILARTNGSTNIKNPLILYIENNTNKKILFSYKGVAYNNTMVSDMQSGTLVQPNSHRVAEMKMIFLDKEPDISSINTISFILGILPYRSDGGFSTADMIESDVITIIFE